MNMKVRIPDKFTGLSIVGKSSRQLRDVDVLGPDFVWRQAGLPNQKHLVRSDDWNNFWPGVVDQLARIERLYWQARKRSKLRWQRRVDLATDIYETAPLIQDVLPKTHRLMKSHLSGSKVVSAIPVHRGMPEERWLFHFSLPSEQEILHGITKISWGFEYCKAAELPVNGIMPELGQKFYSLDRSLTHEWSPKLRVLLEKALLNYANQHLPPPAFLGHTRSYQLKINARTYFLRGYREYADFTAYSIQGRPDADDFQATVYEPKRPGQSLIRRFRRMLGF